jgi:hypothetical protein
MTRGRSDSLPSKIPFRGCANPVGLGPAIHDLQSLTRCKVVDHRSRPDDPRGQNHSPRRGFRHGNPALAFRRPVGRTSRARRTAQLPTMKRRITVSYVKLTHRTPGPIRRHWPPWFTRARTATYQIVTITAQHRVTHTTSHHRSTAARRARSRFATVTTAARSTPGNRPAKLRPDRGREGHTGPSRRPRQHDEVAKITARPQPPSHGRSPSASPG